VDGDGARAHAEIVVDVDGAVVVVAAEA